MDINIFTYGGGQGEEEAWGGQQALSIQKNEKITWTVPILKMNSTYLIFIRFFFYDGYHKFYKLGGASGAGGPSGIFLPGTELLQSASGIFLPGTELFQSSFRTEFSMGSRSRRYRRFLRRHRRFLWSCRRSRRRFRDRRASMRRRRSLRDSLNIIKHC